MTTSTETRVAGLDAKLDWLSARIDALEVGPISPRRWCWRGAGPAIVEALWQELTIWVDWLIARYGLDELLPPCWIRHGAMVEELTALYAGWYTACRTSTPAASTRSPGTRRSRGRSTAPGSGTAGLPI